MPSREGALGLWVHKQRANYRKGKLLLERAAQLEGIGFNWGTQKKNKNKPWEERFKELVAHKEKNGNCDVPTKQGVLGKWVNNQRTDYWKGELSSERAAQLE